MKQSTTALSGVEVNTSATEGTRYSLFVALGILFWFEAALFVRAFGDRVFDMGIAHAMTYFAALLVCPMLVWLVALVARVPSNTMVLPTIIMTMSALLLDGVAMTLSPALYGGMNETLTYGAAWILWGAGCGLLSAMLLSKQS